MANGSATRQDELNRQALSIEHLNERLSARTAIGSFITIATQPIRLLLQLTATAVLARLLTPSDFGLVAIATAVTGFTALFTDIGLGVAIFRLEHLKQDTVSGLFIFNIAVSLAVLPFIWLAAPLSAALFRDPRLTPLVLAMSFVIPLGSIGTQHTALLQRSLRQFPLQAAGVAGHAIGALSGVLAAWLFHMGYWSMVVTAWIAPIVTSSVLWWACPWRPSRVSNWDGAISALRVGMNITGYSALNYCHRQLDNLFLGWRAGSTELGYYSRAYQLMLMPLNVFGNSLAASVEPALSRLQGNPERWRLALLDTLTLTSFLGGGMAALLAVGSHPLILLLYGPQWEHSTTMFRWLAIALFAGVPSNAVGWIYVSLGRTDRMLKWMMMFSPLLAVAFFMAAPHGGEAVAMAYALVMNVMLVPAFAYATHGTPLSLADTLRAILPMMSIGAISAAVGFELPVHQLHHLAELILSDLGTGLTFAVLSGLAVMLFPQYATLRARGPALVAGVRAAVGRSAPRRSA
jgi:polysaccharide transporter, PST family